MWLASAKLGYGGPLTPTAAVVKLDSFFTLGSRVSRVEKLNKNSPQETDSQNAGPREETRKTK